jgi:radical SAM superfamily enzyme YgiQ (UPF0313 family)
MNKILLCDLSHKRNKMYSSEMMPYPIGCIKSYYHAYGNNDVEIILIKDPDELNDEIKNNNEIIAVAFSCYMWNHNLSLEYAKRIKQENSKIITIFGGPDFPLEISEKEKWLKERNQIDFYIEGEGEKPFKELVDYFIEKKDINITKQKLKIDSIFTIVNEKIKFNALIASDGYIKSPRIENLELTPSPYLMGYMDKFLTNDRLVPLIESNRGCPFTCTFCVDGNAARTKVYKVSPNRLAEELEYIASRYKGKTLALADTNFGMFKEDLIFAKLMADIKNKYNYPTYINTSTGKNQKERIIEVAEILKGTMRVAASVQSLDKQVLANIKRSNISEKELESISERLSGGISNTYSEIILSLPGDTTEKHIDSVNKCIDAGYNQIRMHTLTLLDGSVLGTMQEREKYNLKTKHRLLQRCFGVYHYRNEEVYVAETEEVVISQKSLPYEEYLDMRLFNLCVAVFYNENIFQELNQYILIKGLKNSNWLKYIKDNLTNLDGEIKKLFDKFIKLTQDELFETKIEIRKLFENNVEFQKNVMSGNIGYNLLLDTQGEILINHVEKLINFAFEMTMEFLKINGISTDKNELQFLQELKSVMIEKRKNIIDDNVDKIKIYNYNFENIISQKYLEIPKLIEPTPHKIYFEEKISNLIQEQVRLYGKSKEGIGKIIARSPIKDFQRNLKTIK